MIINTYVTEQVARHTRQQREAAAAAGRTARAFRRQPTAPATGPSAPQPSGVRIPRQRRWIDVVVASVR